jgi:membrane-bound metal-dependent hydrolase YbcI (DUF457 family)
MWFLGHFGLGYIFGSITEKLTGEKFNIPLLMFFSLLPDLDFFVGDLIVHRGPFHSIIVLSALFIPLFVVLRRGLPYFASVASHELVGDYFSTSKLQLFWPISERLVNAPIPFQLVGTTESLVEVLLFVIMIIMITVRYKSKPKELLERIFSL